MRQVGVPCSDSLAQCCEGVGGGRRRRSGGLWGCNLSRDAAALAIGHALLTDGWLGLRQTRSYTAYSSTPPPELLQRESVGVVRKVLPTHKCLSHSPCSSKMQQGVTRMERKTQKGNKRVAQHKASFENGVMSKVIPRCDNRPGCCKLGLSPEVSHSARIKHRGCLIVRRPFSLLHACT